MVVECRFEMAILMVREGAHRKFYWRGQNDLLGGGGAKARIAPINGTGVNFKI